MFHSYNNKYNLFYWKKLDYISPYLAQMSLLLFENEKCVNILSCLDLKLQMSFQVKNAKQQKQNKIP